MKFTSCFASQIVTSFPMNIGNFQQYLMQLICDTLIRHVIPYVFKSLPRVHILISPSLIKKPSLSLNSVHIDLYLHYSTKQASEKQQLLNVSLLDNQGYLRKTPHKFPVK